ncbi:ankyrin repeat domain-containing protein 26-like isoform X7 [Halichoerus grypus]
MKKFFSFGSKKGGSSCRVTSSLRDRLGIRPEKRIGTSSFWGGYNIRDKDLRKIHKVASMGDVRKLQEILFFGKHGVNERDKMNRTALHLACANGHPDVVAVLVERKCQLDLFDKDYRTALMKAVQSQNERCVTILLEHGADPNLTDIAGNTALHYAAVGSNTSIAEKLLLHHANTEVRNKDELTPLLLAVSENKPQMVEFLIEKEANVHAVDKLQSSRQLIAEHREEKLNNYLQSKNAVADKSSEEESLSSISIKPGTDDSWPTSDDEDFNFDIKTVPKPNLRALMNASEQFKNVGTKCDLTTPGGRTLSEHDNSDYGDENIVGLLYKPPFKANDFSCPAFSKPSVKSLAGHGVIKEGEVQPATGKEDNGINITQSAPQEQTVKDNLTSAYRAYKSNSSVTMSALGLGEEEDGESPWDSESISESVPKKDIKHLFGAADPKGPRILNEQVEDSPKRYPYVKRTVEVKDSVPNKTVEVKEKQTSKSVFSCWKSSVGLCHSNEPCQRSRDLRVDDKGPSVSQSVTKSQSASTEFGRTTFIEKEKINNIGVVFLLENDKLHDLCKSELPESREHKPDLPAELDLERTSEEEQKRLDESENNHLQTVPKPNLRALMNASEQFKNVGTQCDLTTPGGRTLSEHDNSDYGDENIVGLLYKPPFKANDFSCPAFSKPSVKSLAGHGVIKEGEVQPATGKEDNGINITQSAPQEQTVKDNLTSAYRAYKSNSSVTMSALGLGEEEDGESPWDSESISESVPKKDIKHLFGAADPKGPRILNEQVEDSPKRYPYVKRTVEVKDSVPNKTVEVKEKQTSKSVFSCWKSSVGLCHSNEPCQRSRDLRVDDKGPSVSQSVTKSQSASTEFGRTTFIEKEKINNIGVVFLLENDKLHDLCKSELPESREHKPDLPAELDLERTSEEEQKRLDESENNHLQGKGISQTCILAEKTCENQTQQINVPLLHLQKKSREPEMSKKCDREDNISVYSEHPSVQKREEISIKQGKLVWKNNLKYITSELKQKFGETCEKHKIAPYPKEESLHGNFKEGANFMEIPSNWTNDRLDCEKKDIFAVPVPLVFQAFPEQKKSSLKYACQASSDFSLNENKSDCENDNKPDTEHVFNKNKSFKSDTETKKVRNPLATFEVKEDQELDVQMAKSMNQNSTNSKLHIGRIPQSSDSESHFDKRISCSNEMRQMAQIKRHHSSAVTNIYKKTKVLFQKPFCAVNNSTNNYRSMEPELENVSSSAPCSYRTSEVCLKEELQQDVQKFKNEIGMLQIDILDLEKKKVQLQKEINEEKKRHQSNGTAVLENVYAVAAGLTQQRESGKTENHLFPVGKKEDSDGPAKKTSHEKKEVKKQINFMDDLDLTESSGTASEDSKLPCSNYMSCKSLIVQVGKDCKDSSTLRKIQDAILPYKKSVELKKNQCKQLKRKNKEMEDKVNGLQKELSETKELKLQLEHQKMKWEQELSGLRLEVENAKLKVTVKKQAGKIEQLQENLLSTSLSNDEKGQIKKYIELKQCLECSLDQEMKKNGELEKEITRFKKLLNVTRRKLSEYEDGELTFPGNSKTNQIEMESQINMLKQKVDDLTAKLETASSKCLYLDANNQLLTQELTSMKEMQKKYEKLEKDKKKLEQQVVNLRSQVEFSMVEYSKTEQYKWELEERTRLDITEKLKEANLFFETQLASQESLGQIRETNNTLIRNHMEIRIKDLELELSRMKSFQDFYEKEFEKYKHLYLEELKVRVSLENELNKTNEKLAETSTKLLVEKQQKKFLINPITMSPVLELPSVRNMNNSSLFNRYVAPRESLVIPTSSSWPTKNGIETFLTKMQQEMERNITRELEADAAEFESDSWCMTSSLEPTYESHANDDLLVKSSKEYLRILKKKYMI